MTSTPTVGIVGAGQLARMMIEAAIPLDIPIRLLAASPNDGAARIWPHVDIGLPKSAENLLRFAEHCDVITFDHELVNLDAVRQLEAAGKLVYPSSNALLHAQNKLHQRTAFEALRLPIPAYREVVTTEDITAFAADHGWPVVAKAQRDGYDGRGVWILDGPDDAARLIADATMNGMKLLAERFVPIQQELAGLIARRPGGEFVLYPIVETVQRNGVCHEVLVPAPVPEPIRRRAEELTLTVAEATNVVGIMALELFLADGVLLINEIATRPHNSGHFSIEATATSQFENHLRAVIDWPLGSTRLRSPVAVMANLLGRGQNDVASGARNALTTDDSEVHIHLYGKESRDGRKIGHVTALGDNLDETRRRATRAADEMMAATE
jgi:5-(carboxyamino)imidazole ribonucleotide synthase